MPMTALKHLAKRANVSVDHAEHLWKKAKDVVSSEYNVEEDDPSFWALRMGITKKMLGLSESLSFKQFLNEASITRGPVYNTVEHDKALKILKAKCGDSLWMLKTGTALYRGDKNLTIEFGKTGYLTVDTTLTKRRSQNTSNYYTEILDNIPSRKLFPKRSHSFIGTTDKFNVYGGGWSYAGFAMIPFDGAKIGFVNSEDMWETRVTFLGHAYSIADLNDLWESSRVLKDDTWASFKDLAAHLKNNDEYIIKKLAASFIADVNSDEFQTMRKDFLGYLDSAYGPKSIIQSYATTKNLKEKLKSSQGEIWVSGKCLLIKSTVWDALINSATDEHL